MITLKRWHPPTLKLHRMRRLVISVFLIFVMLGITTICFMIPPTIYHLTGGRDGETLFAFILAGVPCAAIGFNLALKIIPDNANDLARWALDSE